MGLSTFDAYKRLKAEGAIPVEGELLAALQRRLVGMLDDILAVSQETGTRLILGGGTALGAARHGGFIPWDDDLDVNMPRADWARFRETFLGRFAGKYEIYEPGSPAYYPLAFPRIRLVGTSFVTREDLACPPSCTGVFVDVFLSENVPDDPILRRLHGMGSLALGFMYSCRKAFAERRWHRAWGLGGVFRVKRCIGLLLGFLPLGRWTLLWDRWNGICRRESSRFVTYPVGRRHYFGEMALREELAPGKAHSFEGRMCPCAAGLESYMMRLYGSGYMTPPPPEMRESHVVFPPLCLERGKSPLQIAVASHKAYAMPVDAVYLPVFVGAALVGEDAVPPGFWRDDEGEDISAKNRSWCELTALYWAWKNLRNAQAIGLVHYRRHFKGRNGIASGAEISEALASVDAVLPKKRRYYIETTYSQYVHAHHSADLDETRRIIAERHPGFVDAFDKVMKSTGGHRFNMMVMKRPVFDEYCRWLFDVLSELERRLDISSYSAYDARVFGFVSERLLDVYIAARRVKFAEMPVMHLESEHWPRKIARFLARKFRVRTNG